MKYLFGCIEINTVRQVCNNGIKLKQEKKMFSKNETIRGYYNEMVDLLSLRQFNKLMGGDMSYRSKAERAKRVSKSRRVHALADTIILLADTPSIEAVLVRQVCANNLTVIKD